MASTIICCLLGASLDLLLREDTRALNGFRTIGVDCSFDALLVSPAVKIGGVLDWALGDVNNDVADDVLSGAVPDDVLSAAVPDDVLSGAVLSAPVADVLSVVVSGGDVGTSSVSCNSLLSPKSMYKLLVMLSQGYCMPKLLQH